MARISATAWAVLVPVLAHLGGCAVVPAPLEESHMMSLTSSRLDDIPRPAQGQVLTVTLYDAVARTLKYNFDHHVEAMQVALSHAESRRVVVSALPELVGTAGYINRSNDIASGSRDLLLDLEVPPDSTSKERSVSTHDLSLSWNMLDFALSYTRAHQAADRELIAAEQRRKIAQRLIEDTRTAYWRALSFERMTQKLTRIDERTKRAIARTKSAARSGAETPMTALSYERELTQIRQTAERLQHELSLAKAQLAALMNVPPGVVLKLVDTLEQPDPAVHHLSADAMIAEAIFNRPEIRDLAYRSRINEREATAAFFEALPGLRSSVASSGSDDDFLLHNSWVSVGASVAGNLLKVLQLPQRQRVIEAEGDLLRVRSLATTVAIMAQVHISRIRHHHAHALLLTSREYLEVQRRLVQHLVAEKSADLIGEQTLIREEMNLLIAEVQTDIAIGNVLSSSSNIMSTLGYDLQGRDLDLTQDVGAIAVQVRTHWSQRAAVSDRARYAQELERARIEAKRRAEAQERLQQAARMQAKAEAERLAKLAAADAAVARKATAQALAAEAAAARQAAKHAVRKRGPATHHTPATTTQWPWEWPSPADATEPNTSRRPQPKIYTGTK